MVIQRVIQSRPVKHVNGNKFLYAASTNGTDLLYP